MIGMKFPILIKTLFLALLFVSGSAFAEWQFIGQSVTGNKFYIDLATIRKDGNMRTFWAKGEKKTPDADKTLSYRTKVEIDCKKEISRVVTETTFDEPSLMGNILSNQNYPYASPVHIAPESMHNTMMMIVCK